jgi:hypothetical protein
MQGADEFQDVVADDPETFRNTEFMKTLSQMASDGQFLVSRPWGRLLRTA